MVIVGITVGGCLGWICVMIMCCIAAGCCSTTTNNNNSCRLFAQERVYAPAVVVEPVLVEAHVMEEEGGDYDNAIEMINQEGEGQDKITHSTALVISHYHNNNNNNMPEAVAF